MQFKENERLLNRYRLEELIGRGGFSVVFRALDEVTGVELAIKIYAPDKGLDERGIKQFIKEYTLTQPLNHPNLLKATHYDVVPEINAPFLVMPFARNGSLGSRLDDEKLLNEEQLACLMADIGGALDYLHHRNPPIIHQDIKPDNILIGNDGQYMLTDFGISNKMRSTLKKATVSESALTVAYAPPEKYTNQGISPASDIFSFGVMMYECLTGTVPWGGDGGVMLLSGAHKADLPEEFPDRLNVILQACMEKNPEDRPTAKELKECAAFYQKNGYWPKLEDIKTPLAGGSGSKKGRARKTEMMSSEEMEKKAASYSSGEKAPPAGASGGDGGMKTVKSGSGMKDPLTPVPKKSNKILVFAFTGLILLGATFGGYFFLKTNSNSDDPNPIEPITIDTSNSNSGGDSLLAQNPEKEDINKKKEEEKNPSPEIEEEKDEPEVKSNPTPVAPPKNTPSAAELHENGLKAFQDEKYAEAMQYFRQASDQGDGKSSWYIGYMYREGLGVPQNYQSALNYYKKAGDQGDPDGYNSYGFMYDRGMGVPEDEAKAFQYYKKAAEMGLAVAQFNVGYYLDEGLGNLRQDWNEAVRWYEKAASSNKLAQRKLGEFYLFGVGGKAKNKSEAYRWFQKAASNGDDVASKHLKVLKEMDLKREKYSTNNPQKDQMWVRPRPEEQDVKVFSRPGVSTGYKVYYKLGSSHTIQIFPLYKDEKEKRKITDAIEFTNYSSCEVLTENAGLHEVTVSYDTKGKRSIGYFYIIGFTEGTDMLLQIPEAVCWQP